MQCIVCKIRDICPCHVYQSLVIRAQQSRGDVARRERHHRAQQSRGDVARRECHLRAQQSRGDVARRRSHIFEFVCMA